MKKYVHIIGSLLILIGLVVVSCDKDPGPGVAEVKVIDEEGITQEGVHVRMYCTEKGCVVERRGKTNSVGVYSESFELPVVLRVRAVRYDTTVKVEGLPPNQIKKTKVDSVCGDGFVQIENDEVTSETITILECN